MLLHFTSIFKRNNTNSRLYNQNSTTFCSFLTDYIYLCHIRATAKYHKEEAWYEEIHATAEYQGFEHSEDVWLNVEISSVPIKVQCA